MRHVKKQYVVEASHRIKDALISIFFVVLCLWSGISMWLETESARFAFMLMNRDSGNGLYSISLYHKLGYTAMLLAMIVLVTVDFEKAVKWLKRNKS